MIEHDSEDSDSNADVMDLEVGDQSIDMPICIDETYDLIVCKDCGIGVPFERVPSHLKQNHGIKVTLEQVMTHLNLEDDAMTVAQAEDWIKSVWVGRAVQNIPIIKGRRCNECQYSARGRRVMKNHFSSQHRGMKMLKHSEECKVQLVFKGGLQKYIQIEDDDEMEVDSEGESEWERAIEMEFEESMANLSVSEVNGHENLRFMNIFIAKTRWDTLLEGKDLKEIVKIAGAPPCNLNLHEIILCGRRYIHKSCEALDKGSIVVKRLLMSAGYDITSK
jgi:Orsellinic acid/F9775 biosynthesis cluster protein D